MSFTLQGMARGVAGEDGAVQKKRWFTRAQDVRT
jgi:hypothetical protein